MTAEKYLNSAKGYLESLEILSERLGSNLVDSMGLISSHAIELTLKAYLIHVGLDEKQLKKIGHNLDDAWLAAHKAGLPISKEPIFSIRLLSISHDRPFYFRYPKEKTATAIPPPSQLCGEVRGLINIVENHI